MGRCWRLSQRSPTPPTAWIRVACVRLCVVFCCLWMSSARLRPFRVLSGSGDDGAAPGDAAVACGAARQATAAAFRVLARGLGPGIDVTMKEEMTRCARIIIIIVIIARARVSFFSFHLSMKNWREPRDVDILHPNGGSSPSGRVVAGAAADWGRGRVVPPPFRRAGGAAAVTATA
jgi:hypothetical protein